MRRCYVGLLVRICRNSGVILVIVSMKQVMTSILLTVLTMTTMMDCCFDVCGDIDSTYYAPTDIELMHALHGPDNCGSIVSCSMRSDLDGL